MCHLEPARRTSNDTPPVGAAIAALATGQHGVVEHGQLLALGLSRSAITRLVEAGWLHRLHPGVYAVGQPRLTAKGTWLASVLACGPGAALSHRAAGALWGLRPSLGTAEVTVGTTVRRVPGVRVHRSRTLEPKDVTVSDEIPVTTVARTLLDLASVVPGDHVAKALDRAERLRLSDRTDIDAVLARARGKRGAKALREAIEAWRPRYTRSELENRFAELVDRTELPRPRLNALIDGETATHEVDAFWPDHGLGIQLDGWEYHRTRRDREHDAQSDADLELAGLRVMRLTWEDVTVRKRSTVRRLERLVTHR